MTPRQAFWSSVLVVALIAVIGPRIAEAGPSTWTAGPAAGNGTAFPDGGIIGQGSPREVAFFQTPSTVGGRPDFVFWPDAGAAGALLNGITHIPLFPDEGGAFGPSTTNITGIFNADDGTRGNQFWVSNGCDGGAQCWVEIGVGRVRYDPVLDGGSTGIHGQGHALLLAWAGPQNTPTFNVCPAGLDCGIVRTEHSTNGGLVFNTGVLDPLGFGAYPMTWWPGDTFRGEMDQYGDFVLGLARAIYDHTHPINLKQDTTYRHLTLEGVNGSMYELGRRPVSIAANGEVGFVSAWNGVTDGGTGQNLVGQLDFLVGTTGERSGRVRMEVGMSDGGGPVVAEIWERGGIATPQSFNGPSSTPDVLVWGKTATTTQIKINHPDATGGMQVGMQANSRNFLIEDNVTAAHTADLTYDDYVSSGSAIMSFRVRNTADNGNQAAMTILGGQNNVGFVGIGVATPTTAGLLHEVNGKMRINDDTTELGNLVVGAVGNTKTITDNGTLTVTTSPTILHTVTGTSLNSPSPLQLVNDHNAVNDTVGLTFGFNATNSTSLSISALQQSTTANSADMVVYLRNSGGGGTTAEQWRITSAGILVQQQYKSCIGFTSDASGNLACTVSDEDLKDIKGPFTAGLEQVTAIEPIEWSWRPEWSADTALIHSGFSAQNVQKHIPEAVSEFRTNCRRPEWAKDADGGSLDNFPLTECDAHKQVDSVALIAAAYNAIRELDAKVKILDAKANALERECVNRPVVDSGH